MFEHPKRRRTPHLATGTLLSLALLVAACGDDSSDSSGGGSNSIEFLSVVQADVPTLDAATGTTSGQVAGPLFIAIYDTLINVAEDGEIEPRLATEVTPNEDFTEWTVQLRPDVTFTDGTPFDAEAVEAHWTRLSDPEIGSPAQGIASDIEDIEVENAETLRVTLAEPDAHWYTLLATSALALIPSPTALEEHGDGYGTSPETTVGAGPFEVASWQREDRVVLTRNDGYWNDPLPEVDEIVYRIMPDPSLRYNAFTAGEGDINAMQTAGDEIERLRQDYDEVAWPSVGSLSIAFNTREGHPTSSRTLREAMVAAVDLEPTLERAAPGVEPAHSLFLEDSPFYSPVEMGFGRPDEAQGLLDDYLAEAGESSVSLDWVVNQQFSSYAEAFKQEWDKLDGLDVEIDVEQSVLERNRERDFDLTMSAFGGGTPHVLVDLLLSTEEATNLTGIADPELDGALDRYLTSDDPDEYTDALDDIQQSLVSELPYLWTYRLVASYFARDGIGGLEILTDGSTDFAALQTGDGD